MATLIFKKLETEKKVLSLLFSLPLADNFLFLTFYEGVASQKSYLGSAEKTLATAQIEMIGGLALK